MVPKRLWLRWASSGAPPVVGAGRAASKPFFIDMAQPKADRPQSPPPFRSPTTAPPSNKFLFDQIQSASSTSNLEEVLQTALDGELTPIHTSMALVGLAKGRSRNIELVERLASLSQDFTQMRPREVAMSSYGLANGGWVRKIPQFLVDHVDAWPKVPDQVSPQSLANQAWAFATLKQLRVPVFVEFASEYVASRARNAGDWGDFTPLDLGHLAWALCLLKASPQVLADLLTEIGSKHRRVEKFPPRSKANILWVLARLHKADEPLAKQVLARWSGEWRKQWANKQPPPSV